MRSADENDRARQASHVGREKGLGDKNKFWATGVDRLTMRKSVVVSTVKGRSVLAPKLAQCSTKALLAPSGNDAATMLTLSTFRSFAFRLEGTTKQFG